MATEMINGHDLQKMLTSGLAFLTERYKEVDLLNVFPVPDGDTGTNMYLTLAAAVDEAKANSSPSVGKVAGAVSRGALMGARGNSGVILSQLLRGFSLSVANKDAITGMEFSQALMQGVEIAFRAVMKPVEGTILTVAREAAKTAVRESDRSRLLDVILKKTCETAEYTLKQTPDMLPALKEAGVVDAGGMGWLVILQGFYQAVTGDLIQYESQTKAPRDINAPEEKNTLNPDNSHDNFDLKFLYCTEILFKAPSEETDSLREKLNSLGDSLLVVGAEGIVKVHIHTAHPEVVLGICLKTGSLSNVKITNMVEQAAVLSESQSVQNTGKSGKSFAVVSVASGEGITKVMKNLGTDEVITGGQSMNPSIQALVTAVEKTDSDTVIILPNNSNIVMSANQVSSVTKKTVKVVPTKTIPEGIAALLAISPGMAPEEAFRVMSYAYRGVKTGEVTYAVRDTTINGIKIEQGNTIGLFGDDITVGDTVRETITSMLTKMISSENEVCSIYYGEEISSNEAETLVEELEFCFPHIDFELQYGGQPIYYYIISVE